MGPYIIASYPRSGSTWFRFILCNLFYPDVEHDFDSVNKFIPPIDHAPGLLAGVSHPKFYKSHDLETATNIIYLYRHVGDVLESEWWYKKKMYGEKRPLPEYLIDTEYGREWRYHVGHYWPAAINVSYEQIELVQTYYPFYSTSPAVIAEAIRKASFDKMQKLEEKGFGDYPSGDTTIPFCRIGKSGQWKQWSPKMRDYLIEANKVQLKMLGYT